ncbi:MAG TPA: bifunctional (p)ppGpp synthetase/guanosine-3',5'-bis(diphosphate) 3'-pyrophosphohydrolase [Dehalococcoidia bacterium]|jgi:GTP pyrophosphokinase
MDKIPLIEKAKEYLPPEKVALVKAAYDFALNAHKGQLRKSGDPYLNHPLETATTLAGLQLDAATLAAALLHDVPEDCSILLSEIEAKFGLEVSKLVDGVTKLGKLSLHRGQSKQRESQAQNLRKMLMAMAQDLRVVFIKLADRLHNMHTLSALSPEKRRSIAQETLDIYAPLAHRLGIWQIKWQLEDLSFRYLEPRQYHKVARLIATRRTQREAFINEITATLKQDLDETEIKAEIIGRPKHIYSIYSKMNRYAAQGRDFNDIHDLFAVRIVVDTIPNCYKALGVIHNLWHPLPEEFNDFIANPKDNGYQSLHTTVLCQGTTPLEIQIRTLDMHRMADFGVAAHWRYKEGAKQDTQFEDKIAWLRQLIEWQSELGSEEFLESLKTEVFTDQVFVYTPKGEIKPLPKGATPLDFAYRIHTELGHRCIGAKVNGRLVSLNYELKNSDIVDIMTAKVGKAPSLDWLNPDLGFVKTSHAREKIRQWFKKQERAQNIERGKQIFERELKRLDIAVPDLDETARIFNCDDADDFLAAIGYGGITPHQLALKLAIEPEEIPTVSKTVRQEKAPGAGIQVLGVGDLLTQLARCCNPLPGDHIIGYITRTHGVTVHRKDCLNVVNVEDKKRLVEVSWGEVQDVYPVDVHVEAWDRVGLIRDITTVIAEAKVNIFNMSTTYHNEVTTISATIEIENMAQLTQLLSKVQGVRSVISATRISQAKAGLSS